MVPTSLEDSLDDGENQRSVDNSDNAVGVDSKDDAEVREYAGNADLGVGSAEYLVAGDVVDQREQHQHKMVVVVADEVTCN